MLLNVRRRALSGPVSEWMPIAGVELWLAWECYGVIGLVCIKEFNVLTVVLPLLYYRFRISRSTV